jgi:hypothetical protein
MAPPVTDSRRRLRNPAVFDAQADAISGAFEALSNQITELSNQITELSNQIRPLVVGQRIQMALLLLVAAAILAPYLAAWAKLAG